jgi:hypothetical protein
MMTRIIPIGALLIALGIFFGYINPTYTGKIAAAKQQITSYDSALAAAKTFTTKENELIQKRNAISPENMTRMNSYLPDGVDNIQLIIDLNALAARSGITLSDFSIHTNQQTAAAAAGGAASGAAGQPAAAPAPAPTPTANGAPSIQSSSLTNSLDLSVSAKGTYTAFHSFLAAAEQSLRPLDIVQLSVKDSSTGVYTYSLTFRIYWLH